MDIGILIDVDQGCEDLGYDLGHWELGLSCSGIFSWHQKPTRKKPLPLSYACNSAYMKACSKSWNSDDPC